MRKTLCIYILTLFIGASTTLKSQSTYTDKYWDYRDSVLSNFMKIGTGAGMSLPATWRDSANQKMSWSDNTIILGWYIGTLATEYHLLASNIYPAFNQGRQNALTTTRTELSYALQALKRLDSIAESSFNCDTSYTSVNGFFVRDDVPQNFHTNFPNINVIESDYTGTNDFDKEMSQDQAYHILLGLSLVKKFIPDTLNVNGFYIRQEATSQSLMILDWLHRDNWIIKNPVCSVAGQPKDVSRGENAQLLSAGINEMVKYFSDGNLNYNASVTLQNANIWNSLSNPTSPAYQNEDNMHMAMSIAAVGNGWSNSSFNVLLDLAAIHRWYIYPMVNAVLHNVSSSTIQNQLDTLNYWTDSMLTEAPTQGPFSTFPQQNNHGYATNIRFLHECSKHYLGNNNSGGQQYTGFDYMLLHNLYNIINTSLVGITEKKQLENSIHLYPNPFNVRLNLKTERNIIGAISIEIYSMQGRKVGIWSFSDHQEEIYLDFLKSGVYIIKIMDAEGNQHVEKMIKN